MDIREKLVELLSEYFDIGDSYAYNLTRVKYAFACGTMGLDDFEEFDEETVKDIAAHLIDHGVTVQEHGYWIKTETNSTCSKCGGNVISWSGEYDGYERERGICLMHYCPHCGVKMMPQPPKGE